MTEFKGNNNDICCILVCGTPAPGVNGVISAVVIQCQYHNIIPVGILNGFRYLRQTTFDINKHTKPLATKEVTRLHSTGGSILLSSKTQLINKDYANNCANNLINILKTKYLITIGGILTMNSINKLSNQLKIMNKKILITQVPKTIFNDLPLPPNCNTFGFSTARQQGTKYLINLLTDAKSMERWYIVVVIGTRSGHLSLNMATASASTLCIIPEEYKNAKSKKKQIDKNKQKRDKILKYIGTYVKESELTKIVNANGALNEESNGNDIKDNNENKNNNNNSNNGNNNSNDLGVKLKEIIDTIDGSIIKRCIQKKNYGVCVVSEGLVNLLCKADLEKYFKNNVIYGCEMFGFIIKSELKKRWERRRPDINFRTLNYGFELRGGNPNCEDMILARELGYSAINTLTHYTNYNGIITQLVTMKGDSIQIMSTQDIIDDTDNDTAKIRQVNTKSLSYIVSQKYMTKLLKSDLKNIKILKELSIICGISTNEFRKRYSYIALTGYD